MLIFLNRVDEIGVEREKEEDEVEDKEELLREGTMKGEKEGGTDGGSKGIGWQVENDVVSSLMYFSVSELFIIPEMTKDNAKKKRVDAEKRRCTPCWKAGPRRANCGSRTAAAQP